MTDGSSRPCAATGDVHPTEWVPLTDERIDELYEAYCDWCAMTPSERAQLALDAAQRRYNDFVRSVPYDDDVSIFERPQWQKLAAQLVDAIHVLERTRIPMPSSPAAEPVARKGFGGYAMPQRSKFRRK
jgi:hypothetical protein